MLWRKPGQRAEMTQDLRRRCCPKNNEAGAAGMAKPETTLALGAFYKAAVAPQIAHRVIARSHAGSEDML